MSVYDRYEPRRVREFPRERPLEGLSSASWDREHFRYGEAEGYEMADRYHDRALRADQFRHTELQSERGRGPRRSEHESHLWSRVKGIFSGHGPKGYRRSDERIREDVCDLLTDDPRIDASEIDVAVANGEVTLAGTVMDRWWKRLAEDLAVSVSGVRDVHNRLTVTQKS